MNDQHRQAFESVDACIFTGDVFWDDFQEARYYIERWQRALDERLANIGQNAPRHIGES
jgi:hypothetical protein